MCNSRLNLGVKVERTSYIHILILQEQRHGQTAKYELYRPHYYMQVNHKTIDAVMTKMAVLSTVSSANCHSGLQNGQYFYMDNC